MYLLVRSNWDKRAEKVKRATVIEDGHQDSLIEVLTAKNPLSDQYSDDSYAEDDTSNAESVENLDLSSTSELE